MMRTYAGHSTAKASNELYRRNLAKGQTGLSVAFDLPTQTGYDPDDPLARGEVGKVGVPVAHLGDMRALLDGIDARADEHVDDDQRDRDVAARALHRRRGRTRARSGGARGNDAERHPQGVPRARHLRFPARPVAAVDRGHGRLRGRARAAMEPGQHLLLPPAGGRRDAGAGDRVRDRQRDGGARRGPRGRVPAERIGVVFARRLVLRQRGRSIHRGARGSYARFGVLWEELGRERYGVSDPGTAAPALRRAGQLARPDREPAGEQRAADRPRDARGDPRAGRARSRGSSCRRGTRRWGCRGRGTGSGRCGSSRSSPTRRTSSNTPTSSKARP